MHDSDNDHDYISYVLDAQRMKEYRHNDCSGLCIESHCTHNVKIDFPCANVYTVYMRSAMPMLIFR